MKVEVSYAACKGHGKCVQAAPEVFRLDEHNLPDVLIEYPGPELEKSVRQAAELCPTRAVQVLAWVKPQPE